MIGSVSVASDDALSVELLELMLNDLILLSIVSDSECSECPVESESLKRVETKTGGEPRGELAELPLERHPDSVDNNTPLSLSLDEASSPIGLANPSCGMLHQFVPHSETALD